MTEDELVDIARLTVILYRIDELKILELNNADTDPPENHQDNGVMSSVNTQPSLSHSPPEDTPVASDAPPPHPLVDAGNAAPKAREGDLPDVFLLGANYMLYGVYQD